MIISSVLTLLLWLSCVLIIALVLLQASKGSLASVFGGGGGVDSILGTRAGSFLVKATVVLCLIFLGLCITLNRIRGGTVSKFKYAKPIEAPANSNSESPAETPKAAAGSKETPGTARETPASQAPASSGSSGASGAGAGTGSGSSSTTVDVPVTTSTDKK